MESQDNDVKVVSDILLRAASEPEFRKLLFTEPRRVLSDYGISVKAKSIIEKVIEDFR